MNAQTTAKQTSKMSQIGKTRYMVQVAMLGAAAVVLMFLTSRFRLPRASTRLI